MRFALPSSAEGGRAWAALAGLLAGAALLAAPLDAAFDAQWLDWQPSLFRPQPWRAWSAAWVHYSTLHLLANLVGVALVGAYGWVAHVPRRMAWAWFVAWPLTQIGLLARPDLLHYGGLSGVLHAGIVCAALYLAFASRGLRRGIGVATLLVVAVKVASEAPWDSALRYPPGWDIAVAPFAHLSGYVAGLLAALPALAWPGRSNSMVADD